MGDQGRRQTMEETICGAGPYLVACARTEPDDVGARPRVSFTIVSQGQASHGATLGSRRMGSGLSGEGGGGGGRGHQGEL